MGKTKTHIKKPKEPNSFEKMVLDRNTQKIKKVKASKKIVESQAKANLGNKMKIKHETHQPIEKKRSLFRLDSEDEEEQHDLRNWKLKHKGREMRADDDFRENIIASSSSDDQIGKEIVKNYHFAGFDADHGDKQKKKTRAEIYQDIIVNSKQRKAEKTRVKEENQAKIEELNTVFPLIYEHLPKYVHVKKAPQEDDYFTLAQMFSKEQKVLASYVPNDQVDKKREKAKERRQRAIEAIEKTSSSEEMNDDEVPQRLQSERERKMLKPLKKVQHMQKMMEHILYVQGRAQREKDELDELVDSDDEEGDGEDDGEEDGEEDGEVDGDGDDEEDGEEGEEDGEEDGDDEEEEGDEQEDDDDEEENEEQ